MILWTARRGEIFIFLKLIEIAVLETLNVDSLSFDTVLREVS